MKVKQNTQFTLTQLEMVKPYLSERYHKLLVGAYNGLSYEQSAELLGVPKGTIRSSLNRARQRANELLYGRKPGEFRIGDLVRVKQSGGGLSEQRYQIAWLGANNGCGVRQWPSTAPKGMKMAVEQFDTSLLVVDNSGPKLLAEIINNPSGGAITGRVTSDTPLHEEVEK